jgi:hypothetical protein
MGPVLRCLLANLLRPPVRLMETARCCCLAVSLTCLQQQEGSPSRAQAMPGECCRLHSSGLSAC